MNLIDMIEGINKDIRKHGECMILPHVSADGDCLGSAIAFKDFITQTGGNCRIILEERIPAKYSYLEDGSTFEVFDGSEMPKCLAIALDTGDFKRLGERGRALEGTVDWNIDHHKTNTCFADNNYVDEHASSTGEIIYSMIRASGYEMNKRTAEALFTAISTDTGGLRYSNTTPESMRICADLLETGIDISEISHRAFDMMPYPKLMLKCLAIENMRIYCEGRVAMIVLKKEQYQFLGGNEELFDGIVNITVNTEGVLAGALVRENGDGIKVNLRSNSDDTDVSSVAREFGGGGHVRAAGCTIENMDLKQAEDRILEVLCGMV